MKTKITLATVLLLAACSLQAQVIPTGKSRFSPLPQVQGRPGRVVTLSANLYEEVRDMSTGSRNWRPLPGALVGFDVNPLIRGVGWRPVGDVVTTDGSGFGSARYRIPRKHPHPKTIPYRSYFAGDLSHHAAYDGGKLRIR